MIALARPFSHSLALSCIMLGKLMTSPAPSRVFISYAHKDGADLARRLQGDLEKRGFDPWLDTQRLRRGATWTREIGLPIIDG
jgi:hypothetical protein